MEISKNLKDQVIELTKKYSELRENLSNLEEKVALLVQEKNILISELEETKKKESNLINKIEEELGRPVETGDLLQIIQS